MHELRFQVKRPSGAQILKPRRLPKHTPFDLLHHLNSAIWLVAISTPNSQIHIRPPPGVKGVTSILPRAISNHKMTVLHVVQWSSIFLNVFFVPLLCVCVCVHVSAKEEKPAMGFSDHWNIAPCRSASGLRPSVLYESHGRVNVCPQRLFYT